MRRTVHTDEALFAPILTCDEPEEGSIVTRATQVSGWAYNPAGIREVSIWLDGQRVGEAELGLERPDVAQAHPEWTRAERSGFRYPFEVVPVSGSASSAELVVVAEDEQSRRAEERRLVRHDPQVLL